MSQTCRRGDLDIRLEAVGHAVRRAVLYELRGAAEEGDGPVPLESFHRDSASDATEVALVHRHLPKLAEQGFVTVDVEGDHVKPGPQFEDLLPLLDFLASRDAAVTDENDAVSRCD